MNKTLDYYMSLPYKIEIVPDREEGGYAISCPELPGCLTVAESVDEGFRMIEDAKESWISTALEDGIAIPEPMSLNDYSGQFKLRLPKTLHRRLAEKSREEGVSMNQYCVYLLSGAMQA